MGAYGTLRILVHTHTRLGPPRRAAPLYPFLASWGASSSTAGQHSCVYMAHWSTRLQADKINTPLPGFLLPRLGPPA